MNDTDNILPFSEEQIFSILKALTDGDIDGLDGLDLDRMTGEQRARLMCRWLEIKSQRYLDRQAKLAEWAFLKRKRGNIESPADVVRDFLKSQEFATAISTFVVILGLVNCTVQIAFAYRQARAFEFDHKQSRFLQSYLAAKLGRPADLEHVARLVPDLRALANGITPIRAKRILDMSDGALQRSISVLKDEGRAIRLHYEEPLVRIGLAIADIHSSQAPLALPWREDDLPSLRPHGPKPTAAQDVAPALWSTI
tara:strand:+ start:377 stop:1138 length:762 start_codon:yes stop_codon:yes gene_type:complete